MAPCLATSLRTWLEGVSNFRSVHAFRHPHTSILCMVLTAVIGGADTRVEVEEFGRDHRAWFEPWEVGLTRWVQTPRDQLTGQVVLILQLYITESGAAPPIWRRPQVDQRVQERNRLDKEYQALPCTDPAWQPAAILTAYLRRWQGGHLPGGLHPSGRRNPAPGVGGHRSHPPGPARSLGWLILIAHYLRRTQALPFLPVPGYPRHPKSPPAPLLAAICYSA